MQPFIKSNFKTAALHQLSISWFNNAKAGIKANLCGFEKKCCVYVIYNSSKQNYEHS